MPNWCNNTVTFSGENADKANQMFKELYETQQKDPDHGVTFGLIDIENIKRNPFMFNIYEEFDSVTRWSYQTKWAPNTEDLKLVADHVGCDFTHYYDEMGMLIYGRTQYIDKQEIEIDLDDKDFDSYSYSEEDDLYRFEDEVYESVYDILEILLDRKLNVQL